MAEAGPARVHVEIDPDSLARIRETIGRAATDGLLDALSPSATDLAEAAYVAYLDSLEDPAEWLSWDEMDDDDRAPWRAVAGAVARRVVVRPAVRRASGGGAD